MKNNTINSFKANFRSFIWRFFWRLRNWRLLRSMRKASKGYWSPHGFDATKNTIHTNTFTMPKSLRADSGDWWRSG